MGIFYGADAPKFYHVLVKELERAVAGTNRVNYGIADLQPVEAEALRVKNAAIRNAERIETEKQQKKRLDYLNHCTDLILENLPDIGVTVFGPQVSRDMFKKLSEPADHLKMQCKDRKYMEVTKEDFAIVNYACKNPLSPDVIEQLDGKELLICYWKIDETSGPIPHVLAAYAHELTKERVAPADEDHPQPYPIPPLIQPLKVKFQVEVQGAWQGRFSNLVPINSNFSSLFLVVLPLQRVRSGWKRSVRRRSAVRRPSARKPSVRRQLTRESPLRLRMLPQLMTVKTVKRRRKARERRSQRQPPPRQHHR